MKNKMCLKKLTAVSLALVTVFSLVTVSSVYAMQRAALEEETAATTSFLRARIMSDDSAEYICEIPVTDTIENTENNMTQPSQKNPEKEDTKTSEPNGQSDLIDAEHAKAIALTHAGVNAANAVFEKVKTDWEKGNLVYEIEFTANGTEYDYEIHALTGEICKTETEAADPPKQKPQKEAPKQNAQAQASALIGAEKAKAIALAHAGVSASDALFDEIETDREKGTLVYEIEFTANGMEYDYEIDAKTGEICKAEAEWDD